MCVKRLRLGLLCLGVLLPVLSACGSSDPPPFSLACTIHRLPSGNIRAAVTVTNSTSTAATATIYGPAFSSIRHFYPVTMASIYATVKSTGRPVSYPGFAVRRVRPDHPAHLLLRFAPPARPAPIAVSASRVIKTDGSDPFDNSSCIIQKPA